MTTENEDTVVDAPNFLDMSDEDLKNFDPATLNQTTEVNTEVVDEEVNDDKVDDNKEGDVGNGDDADDADDNNDNDTTKEGVTADDDKDNDSTEADKTKVAETTAAVSDPAKTKATAEVVVPVDYKAVYEELFAPFKANGRDIQVKSVEDAKALMQMGANYNKKMGALKPNLKILKLLESNGLLSEEKLSFLIDLEKKNPEAINKLVKDSGIDPLDLSAEKAGEYKPKTYAVDEREMELDAVLGELQESPAYARTLEVVSNKWDGASQGTIAKAPQILKIINSHIENGIYDLIAAEIEHERTFGRLNGLSDLEAYRQVGDAMQEQGKFAGILGNRKPAQTTPAAPVVVQPKPKQEDDPKLRDKKRAAGSTKTVVPSASTAADYNPLGLSDEEFLKQATPKFS